MIVYITRRGKMKIRNKLSGKLIDFDETPLMYDWPLPDENWYRPRDATDNNRHWGTRPRSTFAKINNGSGPRWIPVEIIND